MQFWDIAVDVDFTLFIKFYTNHICDFDRLVKNIMGQVSSNLLDISMKKDMKAIADRPDAILMVIWDYACYGCCCHFFFETFVGSGPIANQKNNEFL